MILDLDRPDSGTSHSALHNEMPRCCPRSESGGRQLNSGRDLKLQKFTTLYNYNYES